MSHSSNTVASVGDVIGLAAINPRTESEISNANYVHGLKSVLACLKLAESTHPLEAMDETGIHLMAGFLRSDFALARLSVGNERAIRIPREVDRARFLEQEISQYLATTSVDMKILPIHILNAACVCAYLIADLVRIVCSLQEHVVSEAKVFQDFDDFITQVKSAFRVTTRVLSPTDTDPMYTSDRCAFMILCQDRVRSLAHTWFVCVHANVRKK
jgi:hypothetical protein